MKNLSIIVSSTRPTRVGGQLAQHVLEAIASTPELSAEFAPQLVDLKALALPFLDEEDLPRNGNYRLPHTLAWAKTVSESDAVLILTPEYNHSMPATLKNALDMLSAEWKGKPLALLSYSWSASGDVVAALAPVLKNLAVDVRGTEELAFKKDLTPAGAPLDEEAFASRIAALVGTLR